MDFWDWRKFWVALKTMQENSKVKEFLMKPLFKMGEKLLLMLKKQLNCLRKTHMKRLENERNQS